MKSNTRNSTTGTATSGAVSATTLFSALSNDRRQHALQYLVTRPGDVPLGDIAEYLAIEEGAATRDRYERILTGLFHAHLPLLVDSGLVAYDHDRELVTLEVDAESLTPYLELALPSLTE